MIRRFLTRILIVVLIVACIYNWQQTQTLQAQVAVLQAKSALPRQADTHSGLPSLPGQLSRYKQELLHRTAAVRSTSKKVLSYVKL